jgi:hypothetical protein
MHREFSCSVDIVARAFSSSSCVHVFFSARFHPAKLSARFSDFIRIGLFANWRFAFFRCTMAHERWKSQVGKGHKMKSLHVLTTAVLMTTTFPFVTSQAAQKRTVQKKSEVHLPYTAVHDPQFISVSDATFLHDPDRVIGVMAGTVAKAYPAAILSQHGLVEDQSPSGPIAVTW